MHQSTRPASLRCQFSESTLGHLAYKLTIGTLDKQCEACAHKAFLDIRTYAILPYRPIGHEELRAQTERNTSSQITNKLFGLHAASHHY